MASTSRNSVGEPLSTHVSPSPLPQTVHTASSSTHVNIEGNVSPTSGDGHNVLSRLHALFRADTRDEGSSRRLSVGERLDRCRTGPAGLELPAQNMAAAVPEVKEREAIKVLVITWNMGDALVRPNLPRMTLEESVVSDCGSLKGI